MKIGASYSTVCEDELLAKLVPQYRVDSPETCRFWQRGVNDTYQLQCADELYSLRVYRHELRARTEVEFEIAALNHLNERGASVAYPVPRRDGEFVSEIDAPEGLRYVVVTSHAPGEVPGYCGRKEIYEEDARLFGASIADLHDLTDDFKTEHTRPRLEVPYLLEESLDVIRPFLKEGSENLTFLDNTAADLHRTVEGVAIEELDTGFCHGDCHGSNVHNHAGALTHFDFDCCGFGFRVFELSTFKWGCWDEDNADELWSSFLTGYCSVRDVGVADLALIDSFVTIRHLWWMALIMGNARDFGSRGTSDDFITHHLGHVRQKFQRG